MAAKRGNTTRAIISISSSDSDSVSDDQSYSEDDESDETSLLHSSDSDFSDDDDDDDDYICDDDDVDDDVDSSSKKVKGLLPKATSTEGTSHPLQALSLTECKAYLRKHRLRLSGTKDVCLQRILEHHRIKDGNAEALYPRSSFSINCTGDVCKGDTVLFTQKVYQKFDKVKRNGKCEGKRTVAGRVVKESYGAAKQQHTFTVEVLWSNGVQRLPPLFPLLIKGRNLYRMRTFRQRWDNEAERQKVLDEKHERGAAARLVRATKKNRKIQDGNGGAKRQRKSHHETPNKMRKTTTERDKNNHGNVHAKTTTQRHERVVTQGAPLPRSVINQKQNALLKHSPKHKKFGRPTKVRPSINQQRYHSPHKVYHSQNNYHHHGLFGPSPSFLDTGMGSTINMVRLPPFGAQVEPSLVHSSRYHGKNASQGIWVPKYK
ncbi:hypothetical protein ACFE04_022893 [Oxalis oulophora]